MFTVLYCYARQFYKRIVFSKKASWVVKFRRVETGFDMDYKVSFFEEAGQWKVSSDHGMVLYKGTKACLEHCIEFGCYYQLETVKGERIFFLLGREPDQMYCEKYTLHNVDSCLIGNNPKHGICYEHAGLISKNHCELKRQGKQWIVKDTSRNGVYVQGKRIEGEKVLEYGDEIHFYGLTLFSFGDVLGIYGMDQKHCMVNLEKVSIQSAWSKKMQRVRSWNCVLKKLSQYGEKNQVIMKKKGPLSLYDLYGIDKVEQLGIEERWKKNRAYEGLRAWIGMDGKKQPCVLDLHENAQGPHGVLAGTTGSGKSVWLQTLLASLAINYSPMEVNFVLVDYKGSGMAKHFFGVPHLAGVMSNFSEKNVQRVMESVEYEIEKREKALEENGLEHIDEHNRQQKDKKLPHIFFVVDEFAEMREAAPGMAEVFVRIARVGRSLGMHLLVSTQKPKGVVENQIWSNCGYRVCLRVHTIEDSEDMVGTKDACELQQVGSGILWTGNCQKKFQTAWSGQLVEEKAENAFLVDSTSGTGKEKQIEQRGIANTQLDVIVKYIKAKAMELQMPKVSPLWCPVLPEIVTVEQIMKTKCEQSLCMGLLDLPNQQQQIPWELDLEKEGHLAVIGAACTGKRTFLQTFLYQICRYYTAKELWCYLFDFEYLIGDCFDAAPQVGGIVREQKQLECSMYVLKEEMEQRIRLLNGVSYEAYKKSGKQLPRILLVLSSISGFRKACEDAYFEQLYEILQQGAHVGIHLMVLGNGIGAKEIPGRMLSYIGSRISFGLQEHYQYQEFFGKVIEEEIVHLDCPGRAMVLKDGRLLELQVAVVHSGNYEKRMVYITKHLEENNGIEKIRAKRLPMVPEQIGIKEFEKCVQEKGIGAIPYLVPYGIHSMNGEVQSWNVKEKHKWLVAGQPGTGKINLVKVILQMQKFRQENIVVFGSKKQRLKEYTQHLGEKYMENIGEGVSLVQQLLEQKNTNVVVCVIEKVEEFLEQLYGQELHLEKWLEQQWNIQKEASVCWLFVLEQTGEYMLRKYPLFSTLLQGVDGIYMGSGACEQNLLKLAPVSWKEEQKSSKLGSGLVFGEGRNHVVKIPLVPKEEWEAFCMLDYKAAECGIR